MNKRVLKRVCLFLESQNDNEAHFSQFWDKTKDFYPEGQSKTKVRQWLQEHPERFELIAGKDGNPCSKVRLKVCDSDEGPCTTAEEDGEIISKLVEAIDKQENGEFLYAVLCSQKSDFFPSQMQDKKLIRKWFNDRGDYFEMVMDKNGGLHSVRVTERAQQRARKARPKRKPKAKKEQEVVSVDRIQETTSTLGKVSQFIEQYGGRVPFDFLVKQKGLFPSNLRESSSIKSFLANFPSNIQLIESLNVVILIKPPSSTVQGKKKASPSLLSAPKLQVPNLTQPTLRREFEKKTEPADKVINFICENGGTVSFAIILQQARELINPSINNNEALFLWLSSNDCHFDMLPNPNGTPYGQVKVKLNIKPRFCHSYVTQKNCSKDNCTYLHICKEFLCGQHHRDSFCNQSHNIRDQHNAAIINRSPVLKKCSDEVVNQVLLKSCFPRVCSDYNKNGGVCPRKEKCHFMHICGDFVLNQCSICPLSHNIVDDMHNINLLKKYALLPSPKMSVDMVKTNIACVQVQKPAVQSSLPKLMKLPDRFNSPSEKGAKQKRSRHRPRTRQKKTSSSSNKVSSKPSESGSSDSDSNSNSNEEETLSSKFQQTSLKVGNIEQSNLVNTSLSGNEKVENWMFSATTGSGFARPVESLSRQRSQSLSSSGGSVQSSVVSSHNSFQLTELEKKVFMKVLEKYDGSAPFNHVMKDDLFPAYFDVPKWFNDHPNSFILHTNGRGQVERVNVFSRRCRLCLDYSSNKGCSNQECRYFHICRSLIEGNCPDGASCRFNHSKSDQMKQLSKRFHLEELTDAQLCKVLQLSTPNVCNFHNKGGCNRSANCPNVHVCKKFARGRCPAKKGCRFGHLEALETPHTKKLLDQYKMGKQKAHYIRKMLLVSHERKTSATTKGDDTTKGDGTTTCKDDSATKADSKGTIKVENEQPKICSQFLIGQCSRGKKCKQIHHSMPYLWQYQFTSNPSSKWHKFDENDCENIEKYFCDVNFTAGELSMATKITPQSSSPRSSVHLNFQSMYGSCHNPSSEDVTEFHLRRLETNSKKLMDGDWFDAQWMWYKLDNSHQWIKYEVNEVNLLEDNYLVGRIQVDSSLRRRPAVFISLSEIQERKRGSTEALVSEKPSPFTTNSGKPTHSDPVMKMNQSSPAPASDQCYKVKVELGTQDYHTIEKLLRDSVGQEEMDINNLEKIKNNSLWSKYISKKKEMTDELDPGESVNERPLFMPCRYDDVERIMKDNVHLSRLDMPNLLGPGHYFTSNASLCLQWCTKNSNESRFLLVCQVLLGTYTQGSANTQAQTRPRRENGKFYDSLVDKITEPTVFVVSDVDQCYPAYIIEFSYASTPTVERNDPLSNFDLRDAGRTLGTQPRQDAFPAVPSYPNYPASIGQNQRPDMQRVVNDPLSTPGVCATQHSPPSVVATSSGSRAFADGPRGPAVSPYAPVEHVEDYVKAPPPYSEEAVSPNRGGVPSEPPPSYSRYPEREMRHGYAAATQPAPRRSAGDRSSRPGDSKKDTDCVVM